ncbi:hypothetical protein GCM10027040_22100 [Halomonas shantousis]
MEGVTAQSKQKKNIWPARPLLLWLPAILSLGVVGIVYGIHFYKDVPVDLMMRDPNAAAGVPVYIGFMSQLGIFFWVASASSCLFSGIVLFRQQDEQRVWRFMFASGIFCLLLAVDDIFMLHENIIPRMGVPETVVFLFYGSAMLTYLLGYFSLLIYTRFVILGVSLAFSAVSIVTDLLFEIGALEDIAKFIALSYWLSYFSLTALQAVEGGLNRAVCKEIAPGHGLARLMAARSSVLFNFNRLK